MISAPILSEALLLGLTLLVEKFKLQCGCESIEEYIKTAMLAQVPSHLVLTPSPRNQTQSPGLGMRCIQAGLPLPWECQPSTDQSTDQRHQEQSPFSKHTWPRTAAFKRDARPSQRLHFSPPAFQLQLQKKSLPPYKENIGAFLQTKKTAAEL